MVCWKLSTSCANYVLRDRLTSCSRSQVTSALLLRRSRRISAGNSCHSNTQWSHNTPVGGTAQFERRMTVGATSKPSNSTTAAFAHELGAACQAVRLACELCKTVQLQLTEEEKADKADDSPVTVADYGAQAVVAWALQQVFPNEQISMVAEEDSKSLRSEEGGSMLTRVTQLVNAVIANTPFAGPLSEQQVVDLIDIGGSNGGAVGRHWVLDPIDGTRGFVGLRQYAVCLGLMQQGEVVVGVLGCPNLPLHGSIDEGGGGPLTAQDLQREDMGVMFSAVMGQGAYATSLAASNTDYWTATGGSLPASQRIHVSDSQDLSGLRFMESYESRHSDHSLTASLAQQLGITSPPLRVDSQVKYGALSRGDAALFMRFPPPTYREKIWDHCAGSVIVTEAGGFITDASGKPLDFSKGRWLDLDRGIVAAAPHMHSKLMTLLQQ